MGDPCGIPYSAYSQVFPKATPDRTIPGREGRNAELPYGYTAFTTREGVELVGSNCLTCHAGRIAGQLRAICASTRGRRRPLIRPLCGVA